MHRNLVVARKGGYVILFFRRVCQDNDLADVMQQPGEKGFFTILMREAMSLGKTPGGESDSQAVIPEFRWRRLLGWVALVNTECLQAQHQSADDLDADQLHCLGGTDNLSRHSELR